MRDTLGIILRSVRIARLFGEDLVGEIERNTRPSSPLGRGE